MGTCFFWAPQVAYGGGPGLNCIAPVREKCGLRRCRSWGEESGKAELQRALGQREHPQWKVYRCQMMEMLGTKSHCDS